MGCVEWVGGCNGRRGGVGRVGGCLKLRDGGEGRVDGGVDGCGGYLKWVAVGWVGGWVFEVGGGGVGREGAPGICGDRNEENRSQK